LAEEKHGRAMKVVHIVAGLFADAGGPSRTVSALCENLGSQGLTVDLLSQTFTDKPEIILPDTRLVRTTLVPTLGSSKLPVLYSPEFGKTLYKICLEAGLQIIHDHGLWLPLNHTAARVAYRLRTPFIVQPHGMLEPWALSYHAWKKQIAWQFYQKQDLESAVLLVATSVREAESIRRVGLRQPIAIVPHGLDAPEWKEQTFPKDRMRTALFLSRVHPIKGLMNLVIAWNKTRPDGWRMIVAGPDEGNHRAEVELAVRRAGLEKNFQFVGPVEGEAKEKLYRDADLFILPSFSESFGMVVAEALAYGVPVITTKGAPWEGLVTHKCGWWIDIGVEPLAEAIGEATNMSNEERQDMGKRGRAYVTQNFSWPKNAAQMFSVYEWVLKQGPKPDCVIDCRE
jgi:glycosyltransferase involved in cell wall biosynthesis